MLTEPICKTHKQLIDRYCDARHTYEIDKKEQIRILNDFLNDKLSEDTYNTLKSCIETHLLNHIKIYQKLEEELQKRNYDVDTIYLNYLKQLLFPKDSLDWYCK